MAIWCASALLVVAIGPGTKISPMANAVPAVNQAMPVISLSLAEAMPVSTAKSDRLPWPRLAETGPALKPAEPFDYAQAEAEAGKKVRRAHAEIPDLCQRHGMHKVWTKDGKSWRCRR